MLRLVTVWADLNRRGSGSVRKVLGTSLSFFYIFSVIRHSEGVDNIAFPQFKRNRVKWEQ